MSVFKSSPLLIGILLLVIVVVFVVGWVNAPESVTYTDLQTVLTTSTATFGTILGIITAGLMFTQGRFSELLSELSEKSPHYTTEDLSLEDMQTIGNHLLTLRKTYTQLARTTSIGEERNLYERIATKASAMLIGIATLSNLKLKQQGLAGPGLFISQMDPDLYKVYNRKRKSVKKEWHLVRIVKQLVDIWEGPSSLSAEKSSLSGLETDVKSAVSIMRLRENIDESSGGVRMEVEKALEDLDSKISETSSRLRKDTVPQLLSQIEQASTLRGKYFYLTLIFITAPLLINLLIIPQLSATTVTFFRQIIPVTNLLSIMGIVFLILYIYKILNL